MAVSGQPIKVFNNGNMPVPWNAKQIPPGVRDFTYVDDIVEGVTRVIDSPPHSEKYLAHGSARELATDAAPSPQHNATSTKPSSLSSSPSALSSMPYALSSVPYALSSVPYAICNIGNSSPVQLMEYIGAIEQTLNKTAKKEFLPMQPGDVPRTEADVTDLVENLGYKPNTLVATGIERFIKWYKQYIFQTLNSKL